MSNTISFICPSKIVETTDSTLEGIKDCLGPKKENRFEIDWEFLPQVGFSSIFDAYNNGAEKANGDTLCFLHDDVKIMCHGGMFIEPMKLLSKPFTGFIGVAGTRNMPDNGCWWKSPQEDCRGAVYHSNSSAFGVHINIWPHGTAGRFEQVVIIDGVFMMITKRNFDKLGGFDSKSYQGWHLYDVDISLKAHLSGLTNYVAPIPLIHKSPGRPDESYEKAKGIFIEKYKKNLPCTLG